MTLREFLFCTCGPVAYARAGVWMLSGVVLYEMVRWLG